MTWKIKQSITLFTLPAPVAQIHSFWSYLSQQSLNGGEREGTHSPQNLFLSNQIWPTSICASKFNTAWIFKLQLQSKKTVNRLMKTWNQVWSTYLAHNSTHSKSAHNPSPLWPQPTLIKVHLLIKTIFQIGCLRLGIFPVYMLNQHILNKPQMYSTSGSSVMTQVAMHVVLLLFQQNSCPIQGNELFSFFTCIVFVQFVHLHTFDNERRECEGCAHAGKTAINQGMGWKRIKKV